MPDATTLLATRRSIPIPMLVEPAPSGAALDEILTIAARVPDHGKLAPWRFILYRGEAAAAIGRALADLVAGREGARMTDNRRKVESERFTRAPLVVGVVSTAKEHVKIPVWEQQLSGAAAAMNLVTAVHAKGYAANWVTEWVAYDDEAKAILGIAPEERVIGFVHVGTPGEPPSERPRPDLATIVSEARAPGAA
ncbi:nitroreductase family protein [Jiella sonneratiae]|uniref:Putative NAD(P)H nitroreductase n=1 Tax=Jiella sonneratiae TaxID=2816856 RepID=A0ABS3IYZ4_9HYPH|nr:nitroreductase [Jiella sonneratiae]MBO0902638.1 nitroreductase [Jiella sonneratiae]